MRVSAIICKLSVTALAVGVASGCTIASEYSAPASFTVSNDAVSRLVEQALTRTSYAAQEDGSPTVDCSGETRCAIAYTVQEPVGFINEVELVLPTRQIWKAMFTDPEFRDGTITVSGPEKTRRGKETSILFTLSCDRGAASQLNWDNVDAKSIKTVCNYTRQVELPFNSLNGPTGVAVDSAGDVYVTDDRDNQVLRLQARATGKDSHLAQTRPVKLPLDAQLPSNVAVMASDVYITDKSRVLKLSAGWDTPIELPFAVPVPTGVAVDKVGDVYVTDGGNGRVHKLSTWSTTQVEVPFGDKPDGLRGGVAVDDRGNVYAVSKDSVWKLSAGADTPTKLPFTGLASPNGVAVDAACNVVVTDGIDKDHSRVVILPTGATSQIELPFTGLNRPTGVALDTDGNVYVTDTGNNRVLELPAAAVGSAISAIRATRPVEVSSACS
jgi:DNA-binding beta-propeller fold protein YncE